MNGAQAGRLSISLVSFWFASLSGTSRRSGSRAELDLVVLVLDGHGALAEQEAGGHGPRMRCHRIAVDIHVGAHHLRRRGEDGDALGRDSFDADDGIVLHVHIESAIHKIWSLS